MACSKVFQDIVHGHSGVVVIVVVVMRMDIVTMTSFLAELESPSVFCLWGGQDDINEARQVVGIHTISCVLLEEQNFESFPYVWILKPALVSFQLGSSSSAPSKIPDSNPHGEFRI